MSPSLTPAGSVHVLLALACIVVGAIQLFAPKRGASHRARGYAFVYAMLAVDASALALYRFTGTFNMFHVGAIANLACIVLAMVPVLRTPRAANWKVRHYKFMAWSYVGLLAAAMSELIVRALQLPTWQGAGLTAALVTVAAYWLIARYRPSPDAVDVAARPGADMIDYEEASAALSDTACNADNSSLQSYLFYYEVGGSDAQAAVRFACFFEPDRNRSGGRNCAECSIKPAGDGLHDGAWRAT